MGKLCICDEKVHCNNLGENYQQDQVVMNFQVQQREKIEKTCKEKKNPRLPNKKWVLYRCGKELPVKNICEEIYEYPEKYAVHTYKEYQPGG